MYTSCDVGRKENRHIPCEAVCSNTREGFCALAWTEYEINCFIWKGNRSFFRWKWVWRNALAMLNCVFKGVVSWIVIRPTRQRGDFVKAKGCSLVSLALGLLLIPWVAKQKTTSLLPTDGSFLPHYAAGADEAPRYGDLLFVKQQWVACPLSRTRKGPRCGRARVLLFCSHWSSFSYEDLIFIHELLRSTHTNPHTDMQTSTETHHCGRYERFWSFILKFPWHPNRLGCGCLKPTGDKPEFPGSRCVGRVFNQRIKGRGWKPSSWLGLFFSPSRFASVCSFPLHVTPHPPSGRTRMSSRCELQPHWEPPSWPSSLVWPSEQKWPAKTTRRSPSTTVF